MELPASEEGPAFPGCGKSNCSDWVQSWYSVDSKVRFLEKEILKLLQEMQELTHSKFSEARQKEMLLLGPTHSNG